MQSRQKQLAKRRKRGSTQQVDAEKPRSRLQIYGLVVILVSVAVAGATFAIVGRLPDYTPASTRNSQGSQNAAPRSIHVGPVTLWWDDVPDWIKQSSVRTGTTSNIRLADYAGPESCQKCHEQNYRSWSTHPHRWMNVIADETTVKGDFSGEATISYLGGQATFYRHQSEFRMRLDRDERHRVYQIFQTIGSRFQQYYIGKLLEGPEPRDHPAYRTSHVLPFGYWLGPGEWVPTVHVHWVMVDGAMGDEEGLPDGKRPDPFAKEVVYAPYAERCSQCHTTLPLGDLLIRNITTLSLHAPVAIDLSLPRYLGESHAQLWRSTQLTDMASFQQLAAKLQNLEPVDHAATLGISCEACHLGSREHAEGHLTKPLFISHRQQPVCGRETGSGRLRSDARQSELGLWALPRGPPAAICGGHEHLEFHGILGRHAR
jgi:hypothetical protein